MVTKEATPRRPAEYYVENPVNQPKLKIADRIDRLRIPVPHRFKSLQEALNSKEPFIVRSEHRQDFDGISGLLKSFRFTKQTVNEARRDIKFLEQKGIMIPARQVISQAEDVHQEEFENRLKLLSINEIDEYCRLLRINPQEFLSEISYSYWELLGGYNKKIIADSAIPNMYHIFAKSEDHGYGHKIIKDGKIVSNNFSQLSYFEAASADGSLIDLYETIRRNGRFDPNNCPIVEAQASEGKNYFLQYHKGANFNSAKHVINRRPKEDEIKATFVRGATPPEGKIFNVNIYERGNQSLSLMQEEEGAIDVRPSKIYSEIMVRRRGLEIVIEKNMEDLARSSGDHQPISMLFKSKMSVGASDKDIDRLLSRVPRGCSQIKVKVTSDGRTAYIKAC